MRVEELRLLPWSGPDGQSAYLHTDDPHGVLSRLADRMEAEQLAAGVQAIEQVRQLLAESSVSSGELRCMVSRLAECLTDVLRVAESRGTRLPVPDDADGGPTLSAEASG